MGSPDIDDYCSHTKAVGFLGYRRCLLINRQLVVLGSQGFSEFASRLPGHILRRALGPNGSQILAG